LPLSKVTISNYLLGFADPCLCFVL